MNYYNKELNITIDNDSTLKIRKMNYYNKELNITIINCPFIMKEYDYCVIGYEKNSFNIRLKVCGNSELTIDSNGDVYMMKGAAQIRTNTFVRCDENTKVDVFGTSKVKATNNSRVRAFDNVAVEARDFTFIEAHDSAKVEAYDSATVIGLDNSIIKACGTSIVDAYYNSTIEAREFSTIYVKSEDADIKANNHFGAVIGQVFRTKSKMKVYQKLAGNLIATLELEKGQTFISENHSLCYTNKALVVAIKDMRTNVSYTLGTPFKDPDMVYEVGRTVTVDLREQPGIYFHLSLKDAEEW